MQRYESELVRIRALQPGKYAWLESHLPEVLRRMRISFGKGARHYNRNSDAIRACCKHFGIGPTYSAIDKFIAGEKNAPDGQSQGARNEAPLSDDKADA